MCQMVHHYLTQHRRTDLIPILDLTDSEQAVTVRCKSGQGQTAIMKQRPVECVVDGRTRKQESMWRTMLSDVLSPIQCRVYEVSLIIQEEWQRTVSRKPNQRELKRELAKRTGIRTQTVAINILHEAEKKVDQMRVWYA